MRKQILITNVLLAAIVILLAVIAFLLHQQRPVTRGEMIKTADSNDEEKYLSLLGRIPMTRIANGTLDVEIQNSVLEVEVTNTPISVEIER